MMTTNNYLMHYGVKGMKWGIRKRNEAYGYARASRFIERRDIRNAKKQKRQGTISKSAYKTKKQRIKIQAAKNRGKKLVEANENYGKIVARSVVKTAAYGGGLTAAAFILGGPAGAIGGAAIGTMHGVYQGTNATRRVKDLRAYRRR